MCTDQAEPELLRQRRVDRRCERRRGFLFSQEARHRLLTPECDVLAAGQPSFIDDPLVSQQAEAISRNSDDVNVNFMGTTLYKFLLRVKRRNRRGHSRWSP